jgi:hypothetical protein
MELDLELLTGFWVLDGELDVHEYNATMEHIKKKDLNFIVQFSAEMTV